MPFVGIAKVNCRTVLSYRANYFISVLSIALQVVLLRQVWGAAYTSDPSIGQPRVLFSYATLAALQFWLYNPWTFSSVPDRVRQGLIAADLARPVPFMGQILFAQVGVSIAMMPFVVMVTLFGALLGWISGPVSLQSGLWCSMSSLLGYIVAQLLSAIVGMVAFWTTEVDGFSMVYRIVAQFLSGSLVPILLLPDWLRSIVTLLPFQASTYVPIGMYVGYIRPGQIWGALATQALWMGVLSLILGFMTGRAMKVVTVNGG